MAKTKACSICGEVIFKINSTCENVDVICQACKNIMHINCGEYATYESKCKSCSGELFKLKRHDYGDKETIKLECINCKDEPNIYYVDKEGKQIDRSIREILIIKDCIEKVENDVYVIESRINDIDIKVDNIEYDMTNLNYKVCRNEENINDIEYDVDNIKSDISHVESNIRAIKRNIENLDDSIYNLERNY